jgi:SulP family sulfate permease
MAMVTNVGMISRELSDESEEADDPSAVEKRAVPRGVEIYEISGPFFFGASYKFREAMSVVAKTPKVRIIRLRDVLSIDATGIQTLREQCRSSRKHGIAFLLSGVHAQPLVAIERAGLLEAIGEDNVFGNLDEALNRAREILGLPPSSCPVPQADRERAESWER